MPYDEPGSDPAGAALSETGLLAAFDAMDSESAAARIEAIAALRDEALARAGTSRLPRYLIKRLKQITPAFFEALFDDDEHVQKSAAVALCALQDPKTYAPEGKLQRVPEDRLRADLERYLKRRGASLFSFVDLLSASTDLKSTYLEMAARVTVALPFRLGGEPPRVSPLIGFPSIRS